MTLVQIVIVFGKPISYFIPNMTFLVSLSDSHNKWEDEALALFREISFIGDFRLTLRLLETLADYFIETHHEEWRIPDEEE